MDADRCRQRQERLVALLETERDEADRGLDALLVTSLPNIRYLTGFSGSSALVVVTRNDCLLVTDFRYEEQARLEAGPVARIEIERTSVWDRLFRELPSLASKRGQWPGSKSSGRVCGTGCSANCPRSVPWRRSATKRTPSR